MQLDKLELKGFKSFGDKVTIHFNEGITGIVGPNGCGKSNVVDAIRWVLGEQKSRMLRSDKMENVIFNGTKKRKPTQMAEVSLTFQNTKNLLPTEYTEVTITRRYFRSGDSEYLLNGINCRLKDITNLFLDTGITSNSYAIIELKMVDDLLNDKDNSRRLLFEEAAGISKFKSRKKETLRKLENTDTDLDRVEDLLFEIDKNMRSLERQARQTQRYYKLKEEYKELSIILARTLIKKHNTAFEGIKSQIEEQQDKKISLNRQLSEKDATLEKARAELISKEKLLSSRQKTLNTHVGKTRQYESEKKIKNERLRFLNDKADNLREQIDLDKKSSERALFSIKGLTTEKDTAIKRMNETVVKRDELKNEYEQQKDLTQHLKEEVDILRKIHRNQQEESFQVKKDLEIKEIQLSSLKQELEHTSTDKDERKANLQVFEEKTVTLGEEVEAMNKQLQKLKAEDQETNRRIENTEKTVEMVREELTQSRRKLDARQNEYNLTKSLVENLEGFPEAIKFLSKKAGWNKKAPLLSDIITCAEEYRVTIENYLEPYLNYYIVEKESDAYQAIDILSDAAKGKAHFFILDSFSDFHPAKSNIFDNAFPATEIIEYDSKYRKLMSFLLDNVYVMESGDIREMANTLDVVFITRSGKYTKRKFSISGGSVGLFEGKKIGRAKNLDKLSKEIKLLEKKIGEIELSLTENQTLLTQLKQSVKTAQIEDLQIELNHTNEQYVSIKTKKEQFYEMISQSDLKREDIVEKIGSLTERIEELRPRADTDHQELQDSEEKLHQKESDLNLQNQLMSQKSTAFNDQNILFHQQENRVNSLEQELSFKTDSYDGSLERIKKNQEALTINDSEIRQMLEKSEVSDQEILTMYDEKEQIEAGLNEAEKDYYAARGDIDEVEKSQRELRQQRESVDELIMQLQNSLNEIKLELTAVKERLSVEFDIDADQLKLAEDEKAEAEKKTDLTDAELREAIDSIKKKLDNIGPINPMAMEAYEEIKERNDFITAQREDLVKAKVSLLSTIDEIDKVAKTTFLEAFYRIEENFIQVFRSLFTQEDDCDLTLSDPDNPLESSIEIIAKPKGKKPLTINQLSGGEKTLTATSLLFAIYLLKPAPFCIFDEVDAPLDDANIDKFNNIIRAFSKDSQFIIVTHNKRTMISTDIIYGVTMVEQGVSRVVPVDLRELA
ncbi:MAG: chromosome segregation protein SMC [Cyclobacteriaceae bacterium]|nr:chromosome segregation protein SMC [Cyclobacteriaceae bacterium]